EQVAIVRAALEWPSEPGEVARFGIANVRDDRVQRAPAAPRARAQGLTARRTDAGVERAPSCAEERSQAREIQRADDGGIDPRRDPGRAVVGRRVAAQALDDLEPGSVGRRREAEPGAGYDRGVPRRVGDEGLERSR